MKKIVYIVILLIIVSCKNQKEEVAITPTLEHKLCESFYNSKTKKIAGYTLNTYLDSTIQNRTKASLLESLNTYGAANGFVIVMEANTGKIKALVGLKKDSQSGYVISNDIPINTPIEPGSLIKTFDLMSLLEDKKADTSSVYDAKGGKISFYGKSILDNHLGFTKLSLKEAFLISSNTIFAKAIDSAYGKTPNQYINNFEKFGLNWDFFQISSKPIIPSPNSKYWSKITLPWMAFGYGLQLTPIQLLTYYNSIAINGKLVQPLLLSTIVTKDGELKNYNELIQNGWGSWQTKTSSKTIKTIQELLRESVSKGACKVVNSEKTAISGYSATTQINYSTATQKKEYASSFIGYFPSEKPKYTILVHINSPDPEKGYYGSIVAGSVVRRIAENIK